MTLALQARAVEYVNIDREINQQNMVIFNCGLILV